MSHSFVVRVVQDDIYSAVWTQFPERGSCALKSDLKVLELGEELAEGIAVGHAATVLAAERFPIGTGCVFVIGKK